MLTSVDGEQARSGWRGWLESVAGMTKSQTTVTVWLVTVCGLCTDDWKTPPNPMVGGRERPGKMVGAWEGKNDNFKILGCALHMLHVEIRV